MDSATREHTRWEIDERRRREIELGPQRHVGLAMYCWTAADGDPLEAIALAIDRVRASPTGPNIGRATGAHGVGSAGSHMVPEFETFKGVIEDMLEHARALPEKWQRSVRRAILDSRSKGLPLEEVAPDLDLDASSARAEEMGLKSLGPGPFDLEKVDPRLRDLLIAHELGTRLLGTLADADAELQPEQVQELERLVAEGLPND